MTNETTARVSRRWSEPEPCEDGEYWQARLHAPLSPGELAAGLEPAAYGPDAHACAREAARQDRLWADLPLRDNDHHEACTRWRYLGGDAA